MTKTIVKIGCFLVLFNDGFLTLKFMQRRILKLIKKDNSEI